MTNEDAALALAILTTGDPTPEELERIYKALETLRNR